MGRCSSAARGLGALALTSTCVKCIHRMCRVNCGFRHNSIRLCNFWRDAFHVYFLVAVARSAAQRYDKVLTLTSSSLAPSRRWLRLRRKWVATFRCPLRPSRPSRGKYAPRRRASAERGWWRSALSTTREMPRQKPRALAIDGRPFQVPPPPPAAVGHMTDDGGSRGGRTGGDDGRADGKKALIPARKSSPPAE